MKIHSGFHDFYDHAAAHGIDPDTVYRRFMAIDSATSPPGGGLASASRHTATMNAQIVITGEGHFALEEALRIMFLVVGRQVIPHVGALKWLTPEAGSDPGTPAEWCP